MKIILSKDWQMDNTQADWVSTWSNFFPTNRAAFDLVMQKELDTGTGLRQEPSSREDIDKILALIDALPQGQTRFDDGLRYIICEGAEDYFNGMNSAEDAARIIHSRASIFVSEQT